MMATGSSVRVFLDWMLQLLVGVSTVAALGVTWTWATRRFARPLAAQVRDVAAEDRLDSIAVEQIEEMTFGTRIRRHRLILFLDPYFAGAPRVLSEIDRMSKETA